jgi:hypothetical protein
MGISFNGHAGAIDWIQSRFKQGKPATLYYDEVRTPTYTDCLNRLFRRVLASKLSGLYHAGGPRQLTLFEIAQVVNRVGGYDPQLLRGCLRQQAGPIPPRAGNVVMDSSKLAAALGHAPFDPWPFDELLVPTHAEWHLERADEWQGSPQMLSNLLYRNPRRVAKPLTAYGKATVEVRLTGMLAAQLILMLPGRSASYSHHARCSHFRTGRTPAATTLGGAAAACAGATSGGRHGGAFAAFRLAVARCAATGGLA